MKKEDFILKAAKWFFFDNVEESLKIITEAEDHERHIKDVYYKHFCQDYSASRLAQEIHDLAYEFFEAYRIGFTEAELIKLKDGEKDSIS